MTVSGCDEVFSPTAMHKKYLGYIKFRALSKCSRALSFSVFTTGNTLKKASAEVRELGVFL